MPLKITDPQSQVAVLNKWADWIESQLKKNQTKTSVALHKASSITAPSVTNISTISDGLTHGSLPWEQDPSYFSFREDFENVNTSSLVGLHQWSVIGNSVGFDTPGGNPPYVGQVAWETNTSSNNFLALFLANLQFGTSHLLNHNSWALLENPGWKASWVFKFANASTASTPPAFSMAKKSFYIGLMGATYGNVSAGTTSPRPDVFIGLRFDTSPTPASAFTLTSVASSSGGNAVYTGTITGGANGAFVGMKFVVTGFSHSSNNGTYVCFSSTATTLTLVNGSAVSESTSATATGNGINDSFFTFEAVTNPTFTTSVRHNAQGQTFVTSVAPTVGQWHRLDIECSKAGIVKLTLDGSSSDTATFTVPLMAYGVPGGALLQCSVVSQGAHITTQAATTFPNTVAPFSGGSQVILSGLSGAAAPLNGTWILDDVTEASSSPNFILSPNCVDVPLGNYTGTVSGYPALTPVVTFGNDDTSSPADAARLYVDFFGLVWNPNLSANAPGTPSSTKPRYW